MSRTLALIFVAALCGTRARAQDAGAVPPENRAEQRTPPSRPAEDTVQAAARRLFEAIVRDDPALAYDVFFPRAAFSQVKAMARPERYYERLKRRYEADIHALHRARPELARAEFVRLALGSRGAWVTPGEEGNRLPYWAARHARLHYRADGELREIEVRVLITWGRSWYVIHLCEFR